MLATVFDRPIIKKASAPIVTFLGICATGVAGFVALEHVSVVEAAFWLLDPTSIELHGVGDDVRGFALFVYVGLILSGLWIGETVVGAAFGGQIQEELKRVQTKRQIEDLSDHVVVCGYGIFGRTITTTLSNTGRDIVVIERDEQQFENIDRDHAIGVHGDAQHEETLIDAGLERADVVIAAIDDSNANVQIAILASQLSPDVHVIVRVGDQTYSTLARRAGADEVIIPEISSGQQVSQSISDSHT